MYLGFLKTFNVKQKHDVTHIDWFIVLQNQDRCQGDIFLLWIIYSLLSYESLSKKGFESSMQWGPDLSCMDWLNQTITISVINKKIGTLCINNYSQTSVQRPSSGLQICGRRWQVVVVHR